MSPPGMDAGLPLTGRMLERAGEARPGRADNRPQIGLKPSLKARVVKYETFERVRRLEIEVFRTASAQDLKVAISNWLSNFGPNVDVLEIRTDLDTVWNDQANEVVPTFLGTIIYAPDQDASEFTAEIREWASERGEDDLLEVHFEHTDRVYRAHILYVE